MCSNSMASVHVNLKYLNQTKIKGGCQMGRKVVPNDSRSDLPLVIFFKLKSFLSSSKLESGYLKCPESIDQKASLVH